MRTAIVIAGGLVSLGLFALAGWLSGGPPSITTTAKLFIPFWFAVALINMWFGVSRAGYSVAEELPILLVIFAVSATAAAFAWWGFS